MHFFQGEAEGVDVLKAGDGENAIEAVFHARGEVFHQALQKGVRLEVGEGGNILNPAGEILCGAGAAAADPDLIPVAHGFKGDPAIGAQNIHDKFPGEASADLKNIHALKADHGFPLEEVGEVVGEAETLLKGGDLVLGKCHGEEGKPVSMPRQVESRSSRQCGLEGIMI